MPEVGSIPIPCRHRPPPSPARTQPRAVASPRPERARMMSRGMRTPESAARDVLPSTQALATHPLARGLGLDPRILARLAREAVDRLRASPPPSREQALEAALSHIARAAAALDLPRRRYINATGIVIHTRWGNSPLATDAAERLVEAAGPSPTDAPEIGPRGAACEALLTALTGAEAALVTTSNAASCLLLASALARGREIACAARDLIEIGHGARLRDILEAGGATVVPVGAANSVHLDDYRSALGPRTALILRIHAANCALAGYQAHVETPRLAELARSAGVPLALNLGAGSLVDLRERGLPSSPTLQDALRDGADLALASGDKLIGGPQAGIIVGRRDLIARLAHSPAARCCRPGKLTLAALEATLRLYAEGRAWEEIPTLRLLAEPADALRDRAEVLARMLREAELDAEAAPDTTECGGAALPGVQIPTWTVRVRHPHAGCDILRDRLLRRGIVARRQDDSVVLDLRSVLPHMDAALADAVLGAADDLHTAGESP
jgi:L-seryl-tRNA(Ser) seleniumtransferase